MDCFTKDSPSNQQIPRRPPDVENTLVGGTPVVDTPAASLEETNGANIIVNKHTLCWKGSLLHVKFVGSKTSMDLIAGLYADDTPHPPIVRIIDEERGSENDENDDNTLTPLY